MLNALTVFILAVNSFRPSTVTFAWSVAGCVGGGTASLCGLPDPSTPQGELVAPSFSTRFHPKASKGTYVFTYPTVSDVGMLVMLVQPRVLIVCFIVWLTGEAQRSFWNR